MADVTESQDVESRADDEAEGAQPLDALLQAVKIAAAGAAVGAAAAAARALSHRDEEQADDEEEEDDHAVEEVDDEPRAEAQEEAEPEEPEEPQEPEDRAPEEQQEDGRDEEPVQGVSAGDAKKAVARAREQLEELLERRAESVSSLERTRDGWLVAFEVLELSRVPESTDVMASYEMELDDDLNLRGYHQVRRYSRSQAGRGEGE